MPGAGDYPQRYEWFRESRPTATTKGEKPPIYTSQGYLWGVTDEPSAGTTTILGADQVDNSTTVRLRNLPGVKPGDRLIDHGHGEGWKVEAVRRAGAVELVCQVERCSTEGPSYSVVVGKS